MPDETIKSTELAVFDGLADDLIGNKAGKTGRMAIIGLDSRYYTEGEIDVLLAGKAAASQGTAGDALAATHDADDSHAMNQINGLAEALAGLAAATQGVDGDALAATHDADDGHAIAQVEGLAEALQGLADAVPDYPVATGTADGLMPATAVVKLDGIEAGAEVNPADLDGVADSTTRKAVSQADKDLLADITATTDWRNWTTCVVSNTTSTTRNTAVNTPQYLNVAAGGGGSYSRPVDSYSGVSEIRMMALLAAANPTGFMYFEFSIDGGNIWFLANGTPSSVAGAIAGDVVVSLNNTLPIYKIIPFDEDLRQPEVMVRPVTYDTTATTGTFVVNHCAVQTRRAYILGMTSAVTSVAGKEGAVTLVVGDVSGALSSALKGAASGLAELGADGKVPSTQLPAAGSATPAMTADELWLGGGDAARALSHTAAKQLILNTIGDVIDPLRPVTYGRLRVIDPAASPVVFSRYRNVHYLDDASKWGADAMVADSTPWGGGTNQRTKWNNIINSLSGETDLRMREGQFFYFAGAATVHKHWTHLLSDGGRGSAGIYNGASTYSSLQGGTCLALGALNYPHWEAHNNLSYLALGLDGGGTIKSGDMGFMCNSAVEWDRVNEGETIFLKSGYQFNSGAAQGKPRRVWAAMIAEKAAIGSSRYIYTTEPAPFDITPDANPGNLSTDHYFIAGPTGVAIPGVSWHRCLDMPVPDNFRSGISSYVTSEFCAFGFEAHNIFWGSATGHFTCAGFGHRAKFIKNRINVAKAPFYFNNAQFCLWDDCDFEFGSSIAEFSGCSHHNRVADSRFRWNGETTYAGGGLFANVFGMQEASCYNDFEHLSVDMNGWNNPKTSTDEFSVTTRDSGIYFRSDGDGNTWRHIDIKDCGHDFPVLFYMIRGAKDVGADFDPVGCAVEDVVYNSIRTTGVVSSPLVLLKGTANRVVGIKASSAGFNLAAAAGKSLIVSGTSHCAIEDTEGWGGATINSGATKNRIARHCGVTTNNGGTTNNVAQAVGASRYFRPPS